MDYRAILHLTSPASILIEQANKRLLRIFRVEGCINLVLAYAFLANLRKGSFTILSVVQPQRTDTINIRARLPKHRHK